MTPESTKRLYFYQSDSGLIFFPSNWGNFGVWGKKCPFDALFLIFYFDRGLKLENVHYETSQKAHLNIFNGIYRLNTNIDGDVSSVCVHTAIAGFHLIKRRRRIVTLRSRHFQRNNTRKRRSSSSPCRSRGGKMQREDEQICLCGRKTFW